MYQVFAEDGTSHGCFETESEARGCVAFDRLTGEWFIYRGDDLIAEGEPTQ